MFRSLPAILSSRRRAGSAPAGISVTNTWKGEQVNSTVFSVPVTVSAVAGRALVVVFSNYQGVSTNHAVSDNIGGTSGWTKILTDDLSQANSMSIWVKFNIPAGITTVNCDGGTGTAITQAYLHEVKGVTAFTIGESVFTKELGTGTPIAGPLTNATPNSIYFAVVSLGVASGNPALATVNFTGSTGGTWSLASTTNSQELDADNFIVCSIPNLIVSSSALRQHVWNVDPTAAGYIGVVCLH